MEEVRKLNIIKISIIAAIISAVLLAVTAVIPSIADSVKNNNLNSGSEFALDSTKTTKWDEGSTSSGQIEIKANVTGQKTEDIDVLFIGTCCSVHGLTQDTIKQSLDSIQQYADVDWFLFNNGSDFESDDVSGHLVKKGTAFDPSKDMHSLHSGNHQALRKFLKTIYEKDADLKTTKGKSYDFIVLEFDGSRIADYYRNLLPEDEISGSSETHDGNYSKYEFEAETSEILKEYYHGNKVIWITDLAKDEYTRKDGYWPSKSIRCHDGNVHTLRNINYNSLKALVAPDLYTPTPNEPATFDSEKYKAIEAQLLAIPGFADTVPEEYVLGLDKQISYSDSGTVGNKIRQAIQTLDEYVVIIEDYVDVAENLKISDSGVTAFESVTGAEGTWNPITDGLEVDAATGHVKLTTTKFVGDRHFKVQIKFEDKNQTTRFIDVSEDGNPNKGPADIKVVPTVDEQTKTIHNEEETEKPLDWEVPIYYVVEDQYKTTEGISVSNPEDNISTSSTLPPNGSTAQETNKIKFQYWSTLIEGVDTYVSNEFEFVPKPDPTTNRYKKATYIAHFAESPEETKHLIVQKVWSDGDDFHLDDSVNVRLFVKDKTGKFAELADKISLSATNKWIYTTTYEYQVYDEDDTTPLQYYFIEDVPEGYEATYETVTDITKPKEIGNTVITNTYVEPPTPPGPTPDPPTPTPTPDPGKVVPVGYGSVQTGDVVNVISLLIVAAIGGASIVVINRIRNKKNKERG